MYPPIHEELAKIRADDLRRDAAPGPRRPRRPSRPSRSRLRVAVGSRLVSAGTWMMRGIA